MRTYKSTSNNEKSRFKMGKKGWLSIGIGAALVLAAVAIVLTLTLSKPNLPEDPGEDVNTKPTFVAPVADYTVGKKFSKDELVEYISKDYAWETHEGIDLIAAEGSAVKAVSDGKVIAVEYTLMHGNVVKIEHADNLVSVYKSLDNVTVEVDDMVKAGDTIGKVSKTMSIENKEYELPHVHLEMLKNGARVNPATYIPDLGEK